MSAISQADYETYIAICVAQSAMSGHRLKVDSKPETVIGTGSYGKVFPAGYGGHPLSQLALKVTVAEDRDYSEFQRQRLAHHCIQVHGNSRINIPQVYEHFSCSIDGGIQGLILDFVAAKKTGLYSSMPAPSLKQILEGPTHNQHVLHLRKLVFSSPQIRYTLVHDILVAVQEFEDLPFVNSDIGPGNILIQESESDDHLVATFIDWGKGHRKALQSDLNKMSDRDFSRFETLEANTYTRLFSGLQSIMIGLLEKDMPRLRDELGRLACAWREGSTYADIQPRRIAAFLHILQVDPAAHHDQNLYHAYIRNHVPHLAHHLPESQRHANVQVIPAGDHRS